MTKQMHGRRTASRVAALMTAVGAVALGAAPVRAQETARYAADFLQIPVGVRALGIGGSYAAMADDGSAFYWNPAGVALVPDLTLTGMYDSRFGSLNQPLGQYYHTGLTLPVRGASLAINWTRSGVSGLGLNQPFVNNADRTSPSHEEELDNLHQGEFGVTGNAFYVTFAKNIASLVDFGWQLFKLPIDIPVGLNFKYIRESYGSMASASGFGLDLGGMFRVRLSDLMTNPYYGNLSVGLAVRDLSKTNLAVSGENSALSRGGLGSVRVEATEQVPRTFSFGLAYDQPLSFVDSRLAVTYDWQSRFGGESSVGTEYRYRDLVALRAGSYDGTLTLGAGLKVKFLTVDYAYMSHDLGSPHRVGASINFRKLGL